MENTPNHTKKQALPEPINVRHRAERLGLKVAYFQKVFKRSHTRVYDAYKGNANTLLIKMNSHMEKVELRRNKKKSPYTIN